jgi:hypothetical protein
LTKYLAVCLATVVLVTGWAALPGQASAPELTRDVTLAELGYEGDDTVHGVLVTRSYAVRWPDAWEVQPGNALTLQFSHSPALDPRSTLTVDLNGTRLNSVPLTPTNAEDGALEIALPENLIEVGYNRLRLAFYMGLNDFNCGDLVNPAVWATVRSASTLHFSYSLKTPEPNLADFPAPFIDNSELVANRTTFVLPDQPTPAELNAAALISAKLGQLVAWRTIDLHTLSEVQARDLEMNAGDLILVGRADRLQMLRDVSPPFVGWQEDQPVLVDSRGERLPRQAGVLWEQLSPADSAAVMLVVTGGTDEAVLTAARALASEASYPRLTGQLSVVLDIPEPPQTDVVIDQVVTLEELGYEDDTAWGTQEQSMNFSVPLPFAWRIGPEAALDLHFAHSAVVHPKRSSLTVLLNDTPVGSLHLDPETAEDGHTTCRLPARLFHSGDNKLSVISNMALVDDESPSHRYGLDCLAPDPKEAWLVVYADSQFNLPGGATRGALSLADYPRAFIGPTNLSELAFVVPDSTDGTIAEAVIRIAERLGHVAEGQALAPQVIAALALESLDQPPGYQILIGRPTQNTAIAQMSDVLPQPFKPGTDDLEPVEALAQITSAEGAAGIIEAMLDPEGRPRLVVTGTTDEGVLWAAEALSHPDLLRELDGDLSIVGAGGSIASAEIRPEEARQPPLPPVAAQSISSGPRRTDWIDSLAIGLLMLTLVILAVVAWPKARQHWKAREHDAT